MPVIACGLPRVPERSAALCVLRHGYRYRPLPYTVLSRIITAPLPLSRPGTAGRLRSDRATSAAFAPAQHSSF